MNANPSTAQLTPFKAGQTPPNKRNRDVEQMLRTARKNGNEGMLFAVKVMRDENVDVRVRLKAAEMIIERAMPRNPETIAAMLGDGFTSHLTIEFVNASKKLVIEHEPVTNRHDTVTNGHDAEREAPMDIVFVGEKP